MKPYSDGDSRPSWAPYAIDDSFTRRRLKLSARSEFPPLNDLYDAWAKNATSPDLARDAAIMMRGFLHIVDTPEGCAPPDYPVRLVGCRMLILPVVARLSEFECKTWVGAAAHDYSRVVATGRPALHQIDARWNLQKVSYVRLILPFRHGPRVSRLLIGIDRYEEGFGTAQKRAAYLPHRP